MIFIDEYTRDCYQEQSLPDRIPYRLARIDAP